MNRRTFLKSASSLMLLPPMLRVRSSRGTRFARSVAVATDPAEVTAVDYPVVAIPFGVGGSRHVVPKRPVFPIPFGIGGNKTTVNRMFFPFVRKDG